MFVSCGEAEEHFDTFPGRPREGKFPSTFERQQKPSAKRVAGVSISLSRVLLLLRPICVWKIFINSESDGIVVVDISRASDKTKKPLWPGMLSLDGFSHSSSM